MSTTFGGERWNSQMVLSNGNLTITANAGNSVCGIASDPIVGKRYMEFVLDVTDGNGQCGFGVANIFVRSNNYLGFDPEALGYWPGPGQVYSNANVTNTIMTGKTNGTVICMAVDEPNASVWWRVNNGNWNNSGTANPATGVGGIAFGRVRGMCTVYPAIALTRNGEQATARFAASSWTYAAPSGFDEVFPSGIRDKIFFVTTTGAQTVTMPDDFNPNRNRVEVIAGGGAAARASNSYGGGGGGGAYSSAWPVNWQPRQQVQCFVGAGGLGTSAQNVAGSGQDSWIGGTDYASSTVGAKGGVGGGASGSSATAGTGGASSGGRATGIGTLTFSGGNGGPGNVGGAAGGGGGAGGRAGDGIAGGSPVGGAGGSTLGGSGGAAGTVGGDGHEWDSPISVGALGSGGGAGGYNVLTNAVGKDGGKYGGGGGGSRSAGTYAGGNGAQGVIAITYVPIPKARSFGTVIG